MVFDRFVGIPWADRGRSIVGCDCYGLLRLVYRDLRGIDLPSYAERYATGTDARAIAALIADELDPWADIEPGEEAAFDAVLVRDRAHPSHIGIVTAPGQMLHVARGETSRIERYRSGALCHRVIGFYRYHE